MGFTDKPAKGYVIFVLKLLLVEAAALSTEGKVVWGMGRGRQGISG